MRKIIIGDVHGCYRQLMELLRKISFNETNDKLMLLGDLVDRGSSSYEVIEQAMKWRKSMGERFVYIRGNHEQFWIEPPSSLKQKIIWRIVGKGATEKSFSKHHADMESTISWIKNNTVLWHEEDLFQCVHAGIMYDKPEENTLDILMKNHSWSRKNLYSGKLTIIGHTPIKAPVMYDGTGRKGITIEYDTIKLLPRNGAICIDTGCTYGNKLTAMLVEGSYFRLVFI